MRTIRTSVAAMDDQMQRHQQQILDAVGAVARDRRECENTLQTQTVQALKAEIGKLCISHRDGGVDDGLNSDAAALRSEVRALGVRVDGIEDRVVGRVQKLLEELLVCKQESRLSTEYTV